MFDTAVLVVLALLLDAALGEPKWLWDRAPHPAVLMGRAIGWCDARFNKGTARKAAGAATLAALSLAAIALGAFVAALPFGWLWSILLGAILIAQRSLVEHVQAVADGLRLSLTEGRRAVSMIVGRDTTELDQSAVARAAIESAAENLSDGVVAPAFWFLIGGLPGILVYKVTNTADSMIGHRTERHEDFGWAAARLDDVLNWVPARLTAALIAATHWGSGAWATARGEAWQHASPNAGWPEAAMAKVLTLALAGPRSYAGVLTDAAFFNATGRRTAGPENIDAAIRVLWWAWGGLLALMAVAAILA